MEENEEEIVPKVNIFTICIHACSTFTMLEEHNIGFPLKKCISTNQWPYVNKSECLVYSCPKNSSDFETIIVSVQYWAYNDASSKNFMP